jgi:4-amino-4-deoxy-L-arabinose transferase-like glycosyltransferase
VLPSARLRAALVALYLFTRLRGLSLLPIFLDETLHVRWALLVSQGEKPWDATWKWGRALTIWLGALVSPLADDLLLANRLVSVALGVATLLATVEIARRLLGSRAAVVAGLFYVLCPFTLFYDRMALTEAGLSAAFALTLVFSIRLAESGRSLDAVLAGLTMALAVLVKAIGVLVLPIPLATVVVLGGIRERWKPLALAYAVGLPPVALALRLFVASENAQHMAELFTGGGGAFAARLGQSLLEGAGWLWTWWTWPLVALAEIGAVVALWRRDRKGLLLALLALYPLVAFSAVLTWRMPRYLLPASAPLLVLAASALVRLASWAADQLPPSAPRPAREGLLAIAAVLVLLPALQLDRAFWTDPSRAAIPGPDRFQYVLGWPSGYGVRDTVRLVRQELEQHPDGVTVVVHANRHQNLRMTPLTLGLAFAREPRVRLEDWDFADPSAIVAFEKWAAAGPTLLVVPRADPSALAPPPSAWRHLALLVARTTKPDGQPCDDVYRLCPPPSCAEAGSSR